MCTVFLAVRLIFECGILYRFIYETEKHSGIAELLEILGRSVCVYSTCVHDVIFHL